MTEKQVKLSKKKQKWVNRTKPTAVIRGSALNFPVTIERKYTRDVRKLIEAVIKRTEKEVMRLFKTRAAKEFFATDDSISSQANRTLTDLFAGLDKLATRRAKEISETMVTAVNKSSQASVGASLKELSGGVTLQPSLLGGDIKDKLRAAINVNTDLITSITRSYHSKVSTAVYDSIMTGRGLQDLIPFFAKQEGITKRHAKNLALDATRKAYTSLNVSRMENVGLTTFEWLHSGGGQKPRKLHIDRFPAGLNGGIYSLKDPPIIDEKTGEKGLPSQLPNCRCRIKVVLVLDEGEPA